MRPLSFRRVGLQAVQLIDGPVDKILTFASRGAESFRIHQPLALSSAHSRAKELARAPSRSS